MGYVDLPIASVYMREGVVGLPPVDQARVSELVASIQQVGLRHPITVRVVKRYVSGVRTDAWEIVAGRHRYRAFSEMGKETIPSEVLDDALADDANAELVMIDENLVRGVFTPAQESAAIARRKEIYEALHPELVHGSNQGSDGKFGPSRKICDTVKRFTKATSSATGKSERAIQLSAERGEKIGPANLAKVVGTSLDSGTELDALAKLPSAKQEALIAKAAAGEYISARQSKKKKGQMAALMQAWKRADKDVRDEFLEQVVR